MSSKQSRKNVPVFFLYVFIFIFAFAVMPALAGAPVAMDKQKILETGEEWQKKYQEYQVDESFLETLKAKVDDQLTIVVYLGAWCGDSRNNLPVFMKIVDSLEVQPKVKYYNVERKPSPDVKYYVKDKEVERVPTFIFYREGKEIGRIIENPKTSLIEDFIEIVF
jgi:hypothetical protein